MSGIETMAVGVTQFTKETGGRVRNRRAGEGEAAGVTGYLAQAMRLAGESRLAVAVASGIILTSFGTEAKDLARKDSWYQ